jgi:hypothetical protein
MVGDEMHGGVVTLQKCECPVDEFGDRAVERTMSVGGVSVKAAGDKVAVEAVDASAVGQDHVANRLSVGKRCGSRRSGSGVFRAHSRGG